MGEVLLAVGVAALALIVLTIALVALGVRSLRRRNEVSRRHAIRPPLPWLASPSTCARLHRRLRDAVAAVRVAIPRPTRRRPTPAELLSLAGAADELEAHAAGLDRDLLLAARVRGAAGQQLRHRLTVQVAQVEQLAVRIATAATAASPSRAGAQPSAAGLEDLAQQLDALEAARDEIARLEAAVGLPSPASTS